MRALLLAFLCCVGCGTRVAPEEAPSDSATADARFDAAAEDVRADAGGVTIPPDAEVPLPEGVVCPDRPDACADAGASSALDALFLTIRRCAPRAVRDVCAFQVTFEFNASGCVEKLHLVKRPPGIDATTADAFAQCVGSRAIESRWSCLSGVHRPGDCP